MKQRLVESFSKDWSVNGQVIEKKYEDKIVEAAGQVHSVAGGVYYEVPVWKLDQKNLNGRVYPKSLAQKLVNESKVTVALMDHPSASNDGSVDRIAAVGKNPHIREGILYVDCYFVDKTFHEKVRELLKHGAGMGLSSSGNGSVDSQGYVLTEDYEIDRYFDFVLTPSYGVFLTNETVKGQPNYNESYTFIEDCTNKKEQSINEDKRTGAVMAGNKKPSLEEKNFRMGIKNHIEKAELAYTPMDKKTAYLEILEYCEDSDFAKDIYDETVVKIAQLDAEIKDLAEKGAAVPELEEAVQSTISANADLIEELEQTKNRFKIAADMVEEYKKREEKLKEMYTLAKGSLGGTLKPEQVKEMVMHMESLEHKALLLKEANDEVEARFSEALIAKQRLEVKLQEMQDAMSVEDLEDGTEEHEALETPAEEAAEHDGVESETIVVKDADVSITGAEDIDVNPTEEPADEDEIFVSSRIGGKVNPDIENYYRECVSTTPFLSKFREDILGKKTMFEACKFVMKVRGAHESNPILNTRIAKTSISEEIEKKVTAKPKGAGYSLPPGYI